MKTSRFFTVLVILPLLLSGCGGKDAPELPPPVIKPDTPSTPSDPDTPEDPGTQDDTPKPWDQNRGKVVTPSGSNWTSKTIDEGVVYYSFSGKDELSNQMEEVFVVDVDLSKSQYQVKLVWKSPRVACSEVQKSFGDKAIATMNANYELGSIFVKVDGTTRYQINNLKIGDTDVPNWKNEGAFMCDGERGIDIQFAGSPKKDGKITGIKGKTDAEAVGLQRTYYKSIAGSWPHLISSAPMLVNDYEPVGENFCNNSLSSSEVLKLNSEDPNRHQRVLHPRTAVALTENNHFIMFVVDGRQTSKGMSCRQLTRFMVKWFNPQYALNMDGGGSTTLCVKGQGDPTTHVVNYPCDNNQYDHAGERARDVHFVVLKK